MFMLYPFEINFHLLIDTYRLINMCGKIKRDKFTSCWNGLNDAIAYKLLFINQSIIISFSQHFYSVHLNLNFY